ncbi:hypothetical protein VNO77_02575 [Canavalia gladiata]|uniref:Uncharacterized protein n=1 Tax=Canavalia gladiata TaxID=3824 RepID=A0AAN9MTG4_CANGL
MGNDTNLIRGASRECLCHGWTLSLNISKLSNLERHTKPEGLADTPVHDRFNRVHHPKTDLDLTGYLS